jgi:hypothetical protein
MVLCALRQPGEDIDMLRRLQESFLTSFSQRVIICALEQAPADSTEFDMPANPEEIERQRLSAEEQQREATAKAVFLFGSMAATAVALRSRAPTTAGRVLLFGTGFEFTQTAAQLKATGGSPSRAVRPTALSVALAAPTPFGVVPPEVWGLRPDYLDFRAVPEFLRFETFNTAADPDRLAAFMRKNPRAAFEADLVNLGKMPLEQLRREIAAIEQLPSEARIIGAPLQTYYSTAIETLRRRSRSEARADLVESGTGLPVALFVSREQAARIESGELLGIPIKPLSRPQVPGALPVALRSAGALPPGQELATGAPSLFPELEGEDLGAVLSALYPSLLRATTTAAVATAERLKEGQAEHFTEVADP